MKTKYYKFTMQLTKIQLDVAEKTIDKSMADFPNLFFAQRMMKKIKKAIQKAREGQP